MITIEVSKNDSYRVFDLAIKRNHYIFIRTLNVFLGDYNKKIFVDIV